jgi:hypothetical protein
MPLTARSPGWNEGPAGFDGKDAYNKQFAPHAPRQYGCER